MLDLEPIKKRNDAATPGEWWINRYATDMSGTEHVLSIVVEDMKIVDMGIDDLAMADAEFIVGARSDIPALIDEVEELRKHLPSRDMLQQIVRVSEQHGTGDMYVWAKMALKVV